MAIASPVACLAAPFDLMTFAVVGRTERFYWGLPYAPLLPAGIVGGLTTLARDGRQAAPGNLPPLAISSS